jgi:hypothetical protein
MMGMAVRLEQLLSRSEATAALVRKGSSSETNSALAFIVIVPGWTESPMWTHLHASAYLRACWCISSQGSHLIHAPLCFISIHDVTTAIFQPQITVSVMARSINGKTVLGKVRSILQFLFCRIRRRRRRGR